MTSDANDTLPMQGVKLLLLQRIRDIVVDRGDSGMTTSDVCEHYVKNWTRDYSASLSNSLLRGHSVVPHPIIGLTYDQAISKQATVFTSHAWKFNFCSFVACLEDYVNTHDDITDTGSSFWFDLVVNDQWNAPNRTFEWWCTIFKTTVGTIGHTLLILSPWDNPIPLTRAWCLWEIHTTKLSGSKFSIAIPPEEQHKFQVAYKEDIDKILNALCGIDVEQSEAFILEDRNRILEAVRLSDGGCAGVNNEIASMMRSWFLNTAKSLVKKHEIIYDLSTPSNSVAEALLDEHLYALLVQEQGFNDEALQLFEIVLKKREDYFGLTDLSVAKTLTNMANIYLKQDKNLKAIDLYNRIESIYVINLDNDNPLRYANLNNKACALKNMGHLEDSWEIHVKNLEAQERLLGPTHKETLSTVFNMAMTLNGQNKLDDAELQYQRYISTYESLYGSKHINVLQGKRAVAGMYAKQSHRRVEALQIYQQILPTFEKVFGWNHDDMICVAENVALGLWVDMNALNEAASLYEKCLENRQKYFGVKHATSINNMKYLASVYGDQNKYAECIKLYCDALAIIEENYDSEWNELATRDLASWLSDIYLKDMKYLESAKVQIKIYESLKKNYGFSSRNAYTTAFNIGCAYYNGGHFEDSLTYLSMSLSGGEAACGDEVDYTFLVQTINTMIMVLKACKRFEMLIEMYEKVLLYATKGPEENRESVIIQATKDLEQTKLCNLIKSKVYKLEEELDMALSISDQEIHSAHSLHLENCLFRHFVCDVCKSTNDGESNPRSYFSYSCKECNFYIHIDCLEIHHDCSIVKRMRKS